MTGIIIPIIATITNLCLTLIIIFLSWLYYKLDEDIPLFYALATLTSYQFIYSEIPHQEIRILLDILGIIITYKIIHQKCKKNAQKHQKKQLEEAIEDLNKYLKDKERKL